MIEIIIIAIVGFIITSLFEKQFAATIRFIRKCLGKEFIKDFLFDENGIDIIDVGTINGEYYGKHYHPVLLCHKALDLFENIEQNKDQFIKIANWLQTNIRQENDYFLLYNFPYPHYKMISPWFSGMAQGRALEVLTHAFEITGDEQYLVGAKNIIKSLYISIDEGGTTIKTDSDGWWFEEYPSKNMATPRVLNGMMYTIMGLITFYRFTKDREAEFLLNQGLLALKNNLSHYDRNGDSYYNILGRITGGDYHSLHIKQLKIIYDYNKSKIILSYYEKWNKFQNQIYPFRLFKKPDKINMAVFVCGMSSAIVLFLIVNMFLN